MPTVAEFANSSGCNTGWLRGLNEQTRNNKSADAWQQPARKGCCH